MLWFDNATQATGVFAYGLASLCCAWVARRGTSPSHQARAIWWWASGLSLLLVIDLLFNVRHHVHDWVDNWMKAAGSYDQRRPLQHLLLGLLGVVGLSAGVAIWWVTRHQGRGVRCAWLGAALATGLWGLELISLHRIDAWLYHLLGPVMRIALLWSIAAGCMVYGAWLACRDAGPPPKRAAGPTQLK